MNLQLKTSKYKQIVYVNILFTIFCILFNLSAGIKFAWFSMWILVPLLLHPTNAFACLICMSMYMRVQPSVKLFSILIYFSFFIILIKELIILNKNKSLNKYYKMLLFYLILVILPLFYSILIKNNFNISIIYYLNMINLLFLFYLLKNKLNYNILLVFVYGIITSSILSLICFAGGLHYSPFIAGNRFSAFMPLCNTLGACCVICISALYVMLVNKKTSRKHALILICVLSLIGTTTLSKNFFVTFCLALLIILIREFRNTQKKQKFITILLVSILALSPFILHYGVVMFERFFADTSYSNIVDTVSTGRLEKWKLYLAPWSKHWYSIIFGLGIGFDYSTPYSSHSIYVGYLSKLGIVGLATVAMFIKLIISNNGNKCKLKYFPIIILLTICIAEDLSFNTFNFVPFIIGLLPTSLPDNKTEDIQ